MSIDKSGEEIVLSKSAIEKIIVTNFTDIYKNEIIAKKLMKGYSLDESQERTTSLKLPIMIDSILRDLEENILKKNGITLSD